jgi:hypothetical protein
MRGATFRTPRFFICALYPAWNGKDEDLDSFDWIAIYLQHLFCRVPDGYRRASGA